MPRPVPLAMFYPGIRDAVSFHPNRPMEVDWQTSLIFNAPRPLFGTTWQSDYRHGVFYAAIDPNQEEAAGWIERNLDDDAYLCVELYQPEVEKRFQEVLTEHHLDPAEFADWEYVDKVNQIHVGLKDVSLTWDGDPKALLAALQLVQRTAKGPDA